MDPVCVNERNIMEIECYGLNMINPLYVFPHAFAKCTVTKYELFKCRKNHKKDIIFNNEIN